MNTKFLVRLSKKSKIEKMTSRARDAWKTARNSRKKKLREYSRKVSEILMLILVIILDIKAVKVQKKLAEKVTEIPVNYCRYDSIDPLYNLMTLTRTL